MRILQIAPAGVCVGPDSADPLGATIHRLSEGLRSRGHDVHVRAARRLAASDLAGVDLIHDHSGAATVPSGISIPILTSLYRVSEAPPGWSTGCVTASWWLRSALPELSDAAFSGVVYPGLPVDDLPFGGEPGDYLLYAAPLAPEFGAHEAIRIARRLERPLRLVGPLPVEHRPYFVAEIAPHLGDQVQYLRDLPPAALAEQAAGATALLHPIQDDVAFDFGAVVAMAAGTPVVSLRRGAMPELVVHGETGFLVDAPWQFAGAVDHVDLLDRRACRRRAKQLFDVEQMVDATARIYASLLDTPAPIAGVRHPELAVAGA